MGLGAGVSEFFFTMNPNSGGGEGARVSKFF